MNAKWDVGTRAKWDVGTTSLGVGIIVEGNEKMRR
jgi:hypothetical protein